MKQLLRLRALVKGGVLSLVAVVAAAGSVYAATPVATPSPSAPPKASTVSGPQAKPPVAPGSKDAAKTPVLGTTKLVATETDGKLKSSSTGVSALAGSVSGVDFQTSLNYCWRNLVYTPVKNTTTASKYVQVRLYNNGTYQEIYTTVSPNGSVAYPAFYGVSGAYYAYLYVWNGSYYQYDEYVSGTNNCNVSVTRTYNSGGWVQLKIQNLGTAYASQQSTELAPFPGSGTYTGTQYDYPAAGGAAIYRWFWVSTSPYGIASHTLGSFNSPVYFTGDL